jgi:predicted ATPase/class 3 adenylate cyclase
VPGDPARRRAPPAIDHRGAAPLSVADAAPAGAAGPGPDLPTGTVTFLFSDIEGSTRLVTELGPRRYGEILDLHRRVLRGAFAASDGLEVGTDGDSFFVVFRAVDDAVRAAADGQRALDAAEWPHGIGTLRVRMGLHTGDGVVAAGTYVGTDVNRAARIGAAGHGGQVLLSEASCALATDRLPAGLALRDLGQHRLKDLRPERLSQLVIDGLPADFPPIRSLDARPNNLPTQLTSFVGREHELAQTTHLLDEARLLTLTGPGGTGKTRLALQLAASVADRYPDGVWWVPLATIHEPDLVPATIAMTFGLPDSGARPVSETLSEHLAGKRLLMVLDNFEQVVTAASVVTDLLRSAQHVRVIATSRARLHVSGEQEYPVPGLPAPRDISHMSAIELARLPAAERHQDPEALSRFEAVRLFVARARAVRPNFGLSDDNAAAVGRIAGRLGGLPLAIELAAARVKLFSPDQILARLERQLDVLAAGSRDLPERQQTLRGAIAWSYDLLDEGHRRLLDRLSVFIGGFDLEMAEGICGPAAEVGVDVLDGVAELVDQSLVRSEESGDGETRFSVLETIREFAAERLGARGEADLIRSRHALGFEELVKRAAPELAGADQGRWLDRLERDHDNIRAALMWAMERPDPACALTMASAVWRFWQKRGHLREARERLRDLLARPWSRDDPRLLAKALEAAGGVEYWHGELEGARPFYGEALDIWRAEGDRAEIANALYNISFCYSFGVDHAEGRRLLEEALALYRELGDARGTASVHWGIGVSYYFESAHAEALGHFEESLALFRRLDDRTMESWALHQAGSTLLKMGETARATETMREALRHFHGVGDLAGVTMLFDDLSAAAVAVEDLPRAARLSGAARDLQRASGTDLARYVEEKFEELTRPSARQRMTPDELERYAAEGRRLSIDEAVAYALGGDLPMADPAG